MQTQTIRVSESGRLMLVLSSAHYICKHKSGRFHFTCAHGYFSSEIKGPLRQRHLLPSRKKKCSCLSCKGLNRRMTPAEILYIERLKKCLDVVEKVEVRCIHGWSTCELPQFKSWGLRSHSWCGCTQRDCSISLKTLNVESE